MRKSAAACLIYLVLSTAAFGQEPARAAPCENSTGYSTRDATVLSMMGWGVCLALGIALLCGSLQQSTSTTP